MKKRREAKEAQIKKEEEAAREAAAKEAKKNEAPAVSAAATMMSGMNSAAGSMNPAMFQMNAAMNPAAAMAGFGAYGFPGYGAFPGMAVPPPMTQQTTQAAMVRLSAHLLSLKIFDASKSPWMLLNFVPLT